ncbi:MAG: hypothetical protein HKN82_17935 [Akkermansiaceae bacterium]|nr:hypothetical protein [Akkermansiaceae bacterium]NNM28458.1 hypothetical protein [Akkermansiaceae bacterium]
MTTTITFVSSRASCGCPIYKKRVFRGYDRFRRPVFIYQEVPFVHRCSKYGSVARSHGWDSPFRGWRSRDRGFFFRRALMRAFLERRVTPSGRLMALHHGHRDAEACASGRCGVTDPHRGHPDPRACDDGRCGKSPPHGGDRAPSRGPAPAGPT